MGCSARYSFNTKCPDRCEAAMLAGAPPIVSDVNVYPITEGLADPSTSLAADPPMTTPEEPAVPVKTCAKHRDCSGGDYCTLAKVCGMCYACSTALSLNGKCP